ncbi:MAG: glycosyltransferase family 39 protein, partial [candidate division Zixibacteria bacterium]|nr:glycosyltransferase family 39 protein [candidate division Zixibacteria bacterium]
VFWSTNDSPASLAITPDSNNYLNVSNYFLEREPILKQLNDSIPSFEESIVLCGPGYGFILAIIRTLPGNEILNILITQSIIGALNCLLLAFLAYRLAGSKVTAILAGIIASFSLTGIALCSMVLTETIFIFFILISLILFIEACKTNRWTLWIMAGLFMAVAAFVRSAGLYLGPFILFVLVLTPKTAFNFSKRKILIRAGLATLVCIGLTGTWAARNYVRHDLFTLAETGPRAVTRYLMAKVISSQTPGASTAEIGKRLFDSTSFGMSYPKLSMSERKAEDIRVIKSTFAKYPRETILTYLDLIRANVTQDAHLHAVLLKKFQGLWLGISERITSHLGYKIILFHFLGLALLWWRQKRLAAIFSGAVYLYFALLCGFTFWQGSRLFFPGQIGWAITCAFVFSVASDELNRLRKLKLWNKLSLFTKVI